MVETSAAGSILDTLTSIIDQDSFANTKPQEENKEEEEEEEEEDEEENEKNNSQVNFADEEKKKFSRKDSNIIPFTLKKIIGIEVPTGFINMTLSSKQTFVMYAVGHAIILHNYRTKEQRFLLGHKHEIGNLSSDASCRWVASSGKRQGLVFIWNLDDFCPVSTLTSAHGSYTVDKLAISQDAKYLVTVGNEPKPLIKLWLWTLGKDEADAVFETRYSVGDCKGICFNMVATNMFMVTFEYVVVFLTWSNGNLTGIISKTRGKKNIGKYTCSTYLLKSNACITTTDCGWAIMWGNKIYITPYNRQSVSNDKIFLKAVKLQFKTITTVTTINRLYVTGDVDGYIKFYDRKLRILFWITDFKLNPIVTLDFHRYPRKHCYEDIGEKYHTYSRKDTALMETAKAFGLIGDYENNVEYYEKIVEDILPTDATLDKKPFIVRDLIVLTNDGQLGYINILQKKCDFLIRKTLTNITAMAVHPKCSIICLGFEDGRITSYNYDNNDYLADRYMPTVKDEDSNAITSIKYSAEAAHLSCGTSSGNFWFLHAVTIEPKVEIPFNFDSYPILAIKFSKFNEFCAYYDENMGVCIFMFNNDEPTQFKYIYRVIAHYRPIVNMEFIYYEEVNRLVTIGEDRYLVEYDISKCEEGTVGIKDSVLIEQTAIPKYFIYNRDLGSDGYFIISENKYKYKILMDGDFVVKQTILGPTIDEPVKQMLMMPPFEENQKTIRTMLFATQNYLGIQLLPADGNPYKNVALKCHPIEIMEFAITYDNNSLFVISKNNNCCFMWNIKFHSVLNMVQRGGSELEPYYGLIDGGVSGWLFKEMQDLFYYMQILNQGENSPHPRNVSDKIDLTELPNLMRSIGYYPTEYELNNLLLEAESYHYDAMTKTHQITFQEFVKLYINHRPAFGISVENIKKSFSILSPYTPINRDTFISKMCSRGEPFSESNLQQCFSLLINYNDNEDNSNDTEKDIPEEITFESFMKDILGTDVEIPEEDDDDKKYEQYTYKRSL